MLVICRPLAILPSLDRANSGLNTLALAGSARAGSRVAKPPDASNDGTPGIDPVRHAQGLVLCL